MDIYERVLVAALASSLAIFLVLGIVAVSKIIQILNHLKRITEKAEHLADTAEAVGEFFERATGPLSIVKLLGSIIETVVKQAKHNKE